jgi:starch synthase
MKGKAICKKKIQEYCYFFIDKNIPLLGAVSNLYELKCFDIFTNILLDLLENLPIRGVLLGDNDLHWEFCFNQITKEYYKHCFIRIRYQEAILQLIEASSDFLSCSVVLNSAD